MRLPRLRRDGRTPPPAPFVVGMGRSGTTLLRLMLDAHPDLVIPPETHFVPGVIEACADRADADGVLEAMTSVRQWGDHGIEAEEMLGRLRNLDRLDAPSCLRAFYAIHTERAGKPRWGDKTPIYVESMREIGAAVPEARFIHLIRDGRDVALSRAARGFGKDQSGRRAGERWRKRIRAARRQARHLDHYLELRYEDLVADPEPVLRRACELCELDYDASMLSYHERAGERMAEMARDLPGRDGETVRPAEERMAAHAMTREPPSQSRVGVWRQEMSAEDIEGFEEEAGELLAELGYPVGVGARNRVTPGREAEEAAGQ
jgi:Sulfotransferase family